MEYGVVGNCKSAALIDRTGAVVWCCLPDFDSASVFAALLDAERGGVFGIGVDASYTVTQAYIPNTNVLRTVYESPQGAFELIDLMPRHKQNDQYYVPPELLRLLRPLRGAPVFTVRYHPRLGYARYETVSESHVDFIKSRVTDGPYESLYLYTNLPHADVLESRPMTLSGDAFLLLSYHQKLRAITLERVILEMERTKVYWLDWVERTIPCKRWNTEIRRSALVLKLLSYQETGAIMAAVTTSLPEAVGAERNWDYRFCWIRDATMTLNMLTRLGHFNVAENFFNYLLRVVPYKDDEVQVMYGIRGNKTLTEYTLDWLAGYKNSRPVRVGNAAYTQRQHDIYGVLLNAILHYIEAFRVDVVTLEKLWTITRSLERSVMRMWREPDVSIWEFRTNPAHFTFSKMLCWVALDRGVKIARLVGQPHQSRAWAAEAEKVRADILTNAWSEEAQAFTQRYGSTILDASVLLMASYGFIDPRDARFVATVRSIRRGLERDGLMFRYKNDDDFGTPTSSFTVCSFWLVKALYQIGEAEEAERLFTRLLGYANSLGLFSEDLDFVTKEQLGNFPQGYSHLALIDCALLLSGTEVACPPAQRM
ncbi:MAG TPA: glycoside hydrolase family 15 protein [Kiritimatiellia bacterium]|nr:glycoside hydrolase family 15 protein [Kiritimatiellia bacterium]HRU71136.1 glycoside hydrolase family 15 protein [Kiritimatiellia bacterium]